jgi:glutathione synthase/RimK-type ligase-like ATP-grasp enzyme
MRVIRTNWDNSSFDWSSTKFILFRTIWDYFDRFDDFTEWLERIGTKTKMINPYNTIRWNMDKHYLQDMDKMGINIPPTLFIETGDSRSLNEVVTESTWNDFILKPAVSGAGRHTYRFQMDSIANHETIFEKLIKNESMLLQEFQQNVLTHGEVAFILIAGKFSHAILKKAKPGDFRVQDDFGGTIHEYLASKEEIDFSEAIISTCDPIPVYARVDLIRDNHNKLCLSELELIEPELWFRKKPEAADLLAEKIYDLLF